MNTTRRIFIVEDHAITRRGYQVLINSEPDLVVCGEAANAQDALGMISVLAPHLVISDISLSGMNGIELTKHLKARFPEIPVLVVSMYDESLYAERALQAGAHGYVMKDEMDSTIVAAVRRVLEGKFFLSEQVNTRILLQFSGRQMTSSGPNIDQLSDRELEVFELIGKGYSTRQIALALSVSPKTVGSHRERIKEKLTVGSYAELVQRAVEWVQTQLSIRN